MGRKVKALRKRERRLAGTSRGPRARVAQAVQLNFLAQMIDGLIAQDTGVVSDMRVSGSNVPGCTALARLKTIRRRPLRSIMRL